MAYQEHGDADSPPVVLIHGFPFSHKMWEHQVLALAARYRVITYDLRGLGESLDETNHFTLEILVDDLLGLLDHLQIRKAAMVGFSMGGYIALRAMEREPTRFSMLVLADTQSAADSDEAKLKRTKALRSLQQAGIDVYGDEFLKSAISSATLETKRSLVANLKSMISSNSMAGLRGALFAMMSRTDTTQSLRNITVPTLVVVGSEDRITPVAQSEILKKSIPNARLALIAESGHMSNLENPEAFNSALLSFLKQTAETDYGLPILM